MHLLNVYKSIDFQITVIMHLLFRKGGGVINVINSKLAICSFHK